MLTERFASPSNLVSPLEWPWALNAKAAISSEQTNWKGALLRRWSGTSPIMVQPPLDHHYIVMHLGGAKQVSRTRDGAPVSVLAETSSLTLVPAGSAFNWSTKGPIAFAHLYLHPTQLEEAITRDPELSLGGSSLVDRVACRDPLIEPLIWKMMCEVQLGTRASVLMLDVLLDCVLARLARRHCSRRSLDGFKTVSLAPQRLRRVLEYVDAHLGTSIALADMVAAAGTSQSHFSHAFRSAVGESPYRYVMQRRVDYAKMLLLTSEDSLVAISAACGFNCRHQFAVMFKRLVGVGPKRFRINHRPLRKRPTTRAEQ